MAEEQLRALLQEARDRIEDMLKGDDGQAFKEARKFLEKLPQTPEVDEATRIWFGMRSSGNNAYHPETVEDAEISYLRKAESELASKDAEIERLRNVAKVNCDIANDCASELAARLKKFVDADEWVAAERNTAEPATDTTPEVDASVDSGMGAEAVEQAELLWAQLPVNRKWTSIPKHEKALVCHLLSTYRTEAEARGRREALEMTNAKWLVLADIVREADSAEDAARELKRLMTGGK